MEEQDYLTVEVAQTGHEDFTGTTLESEIEKLKKAMLAAAEDLEFERAASLRDKLHQMESLLLELPETPMARATGKKIPKPSRKG